MQKADLSNTLVQTEAIFNIHSAAQKNKNNNNNIIIIISINKFREEKVFEENKNGQQISDYRFAVFKCRESELSFHSLL